MFLLLLTVLNYDKNSSMAQVKQLSVWYLHLQTKVWLSRLSSTSIHFDTTLPTWLPTKQHSLGKPSLRLSLRGSNACLSEKDCLGQIRKALRVNLETIFASYSVLTIANHWSLTSTQFKASKSSLGQSRVLS